MLILTVVEVIKLIHSKTLLRVFGILKVIMFCSLAFLTYKPWIVHDLIEKADWTLFYNKRVDIVEQVKSGNLNCKGSRGSAVCELPFEFPILSNGGNDIVIYRNQTNNSVTVTFFVFRNFFEAPSTHIVYSNDIGQIAQLEQMVSHNPEQNWKIKDNWYRTFGQ